MSPAANHADVSGQPVVSRIAVRVEISGEALQEFLRMFGLPAGLVLIEYDVPFPVPAGAVHPHIALRLGFLPWFPDHLQSRLIRVKDLSLHKLPVQHAVHRLQPVLRRPQQPMAHCLPAQLHTLPVPVLLLPVQRAGHHEFLRHNVGNGLRRGKAAGDHNWLFRRFHDGR